MGGLLKCGLLGKLCTERIVWNYYASHLLEEIGHNADINNLLMPSQNISDLSDINSISAGGYLISKSTLQKPAGMLEAGVLLVFKRGSVSVGIAVTYNSSATEAKLNIFGNNVWKSY